ncbi:MAG TPA: OB-fold nucleic acid binding domain-containing protein [Candidatus Nanoarchaeia archaeon]|nr:OB-fold nucleic acid binding domain-containing protein [Candidatus Nanoarchaeia archaeon]
MQESSLIKLSFLIALTGIFLLFIILKTSQPPEILIQNINPSMIDSYVKVKGTITNIHQTPGLYILTLKQNQASIPVVIFKEQNITFTNQPQLEVTGIVSQYKNQLEILAKEVKLIN